MSFLKQFWKQNKKLIKVLLVLTMIYATISSATALDTANLSSYYSFDNDTNDDFGSNDLTNDGATATTYGVNYSAYLFDGSNDYMYDTSPSFISDTAGSVSLWVNMTNVDNSDSPWSVVDFSSGTRFFQLVFGRGGTGATDDRLRLIYYESAYIYELWSDANGINGFTDYHHFVVTSDGSTIKMYIDGVIQNITTDRGSNNGDWFGDMAGVDTFTVGALYYNGGTVAQVTDGAIDEVAVFNKALNQTEITYLYNTGNFLLAPTPSSTNFTVFAKNSWTNASLTNAWVYVNGTNYTDVTGTITTDLLSNSSSLWNITIGATNHFTANYTNVNVSSNLTAYLNASVITFEGYEYLTGSSLPINVTIDGITRTNGTVFNLDTGTHTVLMESTGYYSHNYTINITGRQTGQLNLTGIYDSFLNITATNAWGLTSINDFTTVTTSSLYGTIDTTTTATGEVIVPLLANNTYNVSINATGSYVSDSVLVTPTGVNLSVPFVLYPFNSLNLSWYYEVNSSLASGINISYEMISDSFSNNYSTTTGKDNITLTYPDSYIIRYSAPGFNQRTYYFTLTNGTHLSINLSLVSGADNVTIFVFDTINNPLQDAYVRVLKFFVADNAYNLVEVAKTNFEGETNAQIFTNSEFYKFVVEYNGDTVLTTSGSVIYDTEITLYANLLGNPFNNLFARTGLYGVITFTTPDVFTFTYTDRDSLATQGCINAYRVSFNTTETLVNSSCASGSAGSTMVTVDNTTGYSYVFRGYIVKDGENIYVTQYYYSFGDGYEEDGNGVLLIAVLVLVFSLIGFWRLEVAVVFAGLSVMLVSITGLVAIPITYTAGIFVLSLVTAFIISKRGAA